MNRTSSNGFTLIELLITVVIIGILASIAYPNYTRYVAETRRSDATTNLSRIAALQERLKTQCGFYAANLGSSATPCAGTGTLDANLVGSDTRDGHYTIAIAAPTLTTFTVTATPKTGSSQATNDSAKCATFVLDNIGKKTATGTELTKCWKK